MAAVAILALIVLRLLIDLSCYQIIDLGGQWNFYSANKTAYGRGQVPGDVFSHLHKAAIIPDPLFADNHLLQKWVSAENWTYVRTFNISKKTLKSRVLFLRLHGVDTVSSVFINRQLMIKTNNQFVRYFVRVDEVLSEENVIEVQFTSPVLYAKEKSAEYFKNRGHLVPPVCPPSSYHGQCHPNFIRKAQYSFGWDWGPALPTVGIWKPIDIVAFNDFFVDDFSWITKRTLDSWFVHGEVRVLAETKPVKVTLRIIIAELDVDQYETYTVGGSQPILLKFTIEIAREKVELWWPNGEGNQKLYDIKMNFEGNEIVRHIGFRHVELVQDYVNQTRLSMGRHFYFKINDRPIFLKGSNWIPVSMFLSANNTVRMEFLIDSAVEAGMNALRVWGGGVYESEEFYDYVDRKGILLWQDLMFACALYPVDDKFIETVRTEVEQQVWRIRRYPSVLIWAGNNENEIAIRSHWWQVKNYTENAQVKDYVYLYSRVVKPLVEAADPSRPFLISSPSNGVRTEEEGGISSNPGDPRYGDIHFYDEIVDLWRDSSYLIPRCATEFGVQSFPFASTMLRHIDTSQWWYASQQLMHRQHHPGGLLTNLIMVFSHLPIPFQCPQSLVNLHQCKYLTSPSFIDRFAYFSQVHQMITYKVQTEHYRRYRNRLLPSGMGNTMCALFWQLNDVWAAPTWSSIDINLNWKMVHYEARRFMAPVVLVIYASGVNNIGISVVNDRPTKITNAKLQIDMLAWSNRFDPVYTENKTVNINSLSADEVILYKSVNMLRTSDADFLIRGRLLNHNDELIAPESVLLPDKLYEIDFNIFGDVNITDMTRIDKLTYSLSIQATSLSPFTWISVSKTFLGWFSDNGFTMTYPTREIKLYLREPIDLNIYDFSVCNLKNCAAL